MLDPEDEEIVPQVQSQLWGIVVVMLLLAVALSAVSPVAIPAAPYLGPGAGVLGVALLAWAFPRAKFYTLFLGGVHLCAASGVLLFAGLVGPRGNAGIAAGLLVELPALYFAYYFIMHVRSTRDVSPTEYTPLGLWTVGVIGFYVFSVAAASGFSVWALTGAPVGIPIYVGGQALVCLLLVWTLRVVDLQILGRTDQHRGFHLRASDVRSTGASPASGRFIPAKASKKVRGDCPLCGGHLRTVERSCPSCGLVQPFGWCLRSDHLLVPCPSCRAPNKSGSAACQACGAAVGRLILCTSCGEERPFTQWRPVEATPGGPRGAVPS